MEGSVNLMVGFGAAIGAVFLLICLKWSRDEYLEWRNRPTPSSPPSIPLPTIPSIPVTIARHEEEVLSVPHL